MCNDQLSPESLPLLLCLSVQPLGNRYELATRNPAQQRQISATRAKAAATCF